MQIPGGECHWPSAEMPDIGGKNTHEDKHESSINTHIVEGLAGIGVGSGVAAPSVQPNTYQRIWRISMDVHQPVASESVIT